MRPDQSSPNKYDTATIRKLLLAAFSDEDFTIFCYDHFRSVHQKFAGGMTFSSKVQLLLEYCEKNNSLDKLLSLVEEYNPDQYKKFAPRLQKAETQRQKRQDTEKPYSQGAGKDELSPQDAMTTPVQPTPPPTTPTPLSSEDGEQFDVFISYSRRDRKTVDKLLKRLRADGFQLWVDEEQIGGGDSLRKVIVNGILQSRHIIVCLSPAYLESKWTNFESAVTQALDPANQQRRLIPVKIAPVTIPAEYGWLYCPDFTNPDDWEQEYLKTIKNLRPLRAPKEELPAQDDASLVEATPTKELLDQTVKSAIPELWLQNRFYYDPFAFLEAEKMPLEILEETFVDHPDFDGHIINPNRSAVMIWPPGSGKTAGRLRLEESLKRRRQYPMDRPPYAPLVVIYNNFERMVEYLPDTKLSDHKTPLLAAVAEALFLFITDSPDQFLALDYKVRKWWWAFLENHLDGEQLDFRLQDSTSLTTDWQKATQQSSLFRPGSTLESILKGLKEPLDHLGIDALFFLVDGVDGYMETQTLPNLEVLVAPLLNALPLLSLKGVRWKFFLPNLLEKIVRTSAGYQTRRLDIVSITWDENRLTKFLQLRMESASTFPGEREPRVHALSELCDEELFNTVNLDQELVRMALQHKRLGPPRALLNLGKKLLQKLSNKTVLSLGDWNDFEEQVQQDLRPEAPT